MCSGNPLLENFSKNVQENAVGFDFRGLSDLQLRQAQEVTADQLKYMSTDKQDQRTNELQKEVDRRDAPRRLADERRALIAQQEAQMAAYEQQLKDQQDAQAKTVADLTAKQAEKVAGIRARGTAVTQSLQILGRPNATAPTAAMTKRAERPKGARTTSASLRMGSTSSGVGSGANISA
jgi:hypothetical protein